MNTDLANSLILVMVNQGNTDEVMNTARAAGARGGTIIRSRFMGIAELDGLYESMQSISFENLSFTYGREQVFRDTNAKIEKGKIICLMGASGAGKSTVFKLLLNVFAPTQGEIVLQGDFAEKRVLTAKDRGLFAYVPQGNLLLSGTLRDNLLVTNQNATQEYHSQTV